MFFCLRQKALTQERLRRQAGARLDPPERRLKRRGGPESVPVARKNVPGRKSHRVVSAPNDAAGSCNFDAPYVRLNFFDVVIHYASPVPALPRARDALTSPAVRAFQE